MAVTFLTKGYEVKTDAILFARAARKDDSVFLTVYRPGETEAVHVVPMEPSALFSAVRQAELPISCLGMEYLYLVNGRYENDIFAHSYSNGRGVIISEDYDWGDDTLPKHKDCNTIAYSTHVRGFTMDESSDVEHKGTFAGIIEKIPYLNCLSVNQLQLQPVYSVLENGGKTNFWGYGRGYYLAPNPDFAVENAATELKTLVKELHLNNIELILEMPFSDDISFADMEDCLIYWMTNYHVDGFIVPEYRYPYQLFIGNPLLRSVKLLYRDYGADYAYRRFLRGDRDTLPEFLRINSYASTEEGSFRFLTAPSGFTMADLVSYRNKHNEANGEDNLDGPVDNFASGYGAEGKTNDKSILSTRRRQLRNAFALLLSALAVPAFQAGDEFLNSQGGNDNPYCQDNPIGWVNWRRDEEAEMLRKYVRELIAYRRDVLSPFLKAAEERRTQNSDGIPLLSFHGEDAWIVPEPQNGSYVGILYHSDEKFLYIVYNMDRNDHLIAVPNIGKDYSWYQIFDTGRGFYDEELPLDKQNKVISSPAQTITFYIARKCV